MSSSIDVEVSVSSVICLGYCPLCCSVAFSVGLEQVLLVSAIVIAVVLPIHELLNHHRVMVSKPARSESRKAPKGRDRTRRLMPVEAAFRRVLLIEVEAHVVEQGADSSLAVLENRFQVLPHPQLDLLGADLSSSIAKAEYRRP
jgi:hypothetical protein